MTTLRFYGGVGEIGGNKILLKDKNAKIYLDFGQSFSFGEDFFYEWLAPRTANGLEVYFEFDLVPKIEGIYSKEMLRFTNMKYKKPNIDGIFISHAHSDHWGHLPFVDESIPLYIGEFAYNMLEVSKKLYPQFFNYGKHEKIKTFKTGDVIKVKHLTIEPVHVDHSIPGAYGFIIHTSKGAVVYTGDLRLHGPKAGMTKDFINKAKKAKPIALITEGTRMGNDNMPKNATEKDVMEKFDEYMKKAKGLVVANLTARNIDRFMSFYKAAVNNKRKVVIDTRTAYLLDNLKQYINCPDVKNDPNIKVYFRLKKSRDFDEKDYFVWERDYMGKMITFKEMSKNQNKLAMMLSFYSLMELIYIKPVNGSIFIYSLSEHFLEGEDNEEQRTVLMNWLKHFDMKMLKAHASGHANINDLNYIIKEIKPKKIIPVHTQHPELFKKYHKNVVMPKYDKVLRI
ncbi:MBL fold metallo-hydrolase [Candidatus Woesearchaeota archaeon]|nr:MAG: MBL fold metallo-hydrolase [Candidatus Woesearchaeota archaeon]